MEKHLLMTGNHMPQAKTGIFQHNFGKSMQFQRNSGKSERALEC
jgi:hypothetical protein